MPHTAQKHDLIDLESLSRSSPVTEATTRQLALHVLDRHLETRRQTLDDHNESLTM
jgi:hypothetical protein